MSLLVPPLVRGTPHEAVNEARRRLAYANQFSLDLGTARELHEIEAAGATLWAIDGSTSGKVDIRFGSPSAPAITFSPGMKVSGLPFGALYVTNAAQAGGTITLLYSDAELSTENPARFTVTTRPYNRTTATSFSAGAGATGALWSADPNRTAFSIIRRVGFTNTLYIQPDSVPATGDGLGIGLGSSDVPVFVGPVYIGASEVWHYRAPAAMDWSILEHFGA